VRIRGDGAATTAKQPPCAWVGGRQGRSEAFSVLYGDKAAGGAPGGEGGDGGGDAPDDDANQTSMSTRRR
jgi:hypothetical protein